jgi:hydrogenase/urease accessory protein HupE
MRTWRWLFLLGLAVLGGPVAADELRPAVVELSESEPGRWSLDWKVPVAPSRQEQVAPLADPVVPEGCEMAGPAVRRAAGRDLLGTVRIACPEKLAGLHFGLTELVGNADAIARFVPLGEPVQTFRLTASAPTAVIAAQPGKWAVARDYLLIGIDHILTGWDHLVFVVLLVLLVRRGRAVVAAATAFTVAHSITLAATTLGWTGMASGPVEALIALSIVYLAVEVIHALRHPDQHSLTRRAPWLAAFLFGLLHGFGFAGALAEIGLPQGEIALALVAFNLGVEVGQVLVIVAVVSLLAAIRKAAWMDETAIIRVTAYGMGITGSFWLVERVVGSLVSGG